LTEKRRERKEKMVMWKEKNRKSLKMSSLSHVLPKGKQTPNKRNDKWGE
jgi:hypothetical protein